MPGPWGSGRIHHVSDQQQKPLSDPEGFLLSVASPVLFFITSYEAKTFEFSRWVINQPCPGFRVPGNATSAQAGIFAGPPCPLRPELIISNSSMSRMVRTHASHPPIRKGMKYGNKTIPAPPTYSPRRKPLSSPFLCIDVQSSFSRHGTHVCARVV